MNKLTFLVSEILELMNSNVLLFQSDLLRFILENTIFKFENNVKSLTSQTDSHILVSRVVRTSSEFQSTLSHRHN